MRSQTVKSRVWGLGTMKWSSCLFLLVGSVGIICVQSVDEKSEQSSQCSVVEATTKRDPHLREIEVDLGDGPEVALMYIPPTNLSSYYRNDDVPRTTQAVVPKHKGLSGKFINLSNKDLRLFWEPTLKSRNPVLMRSMPPFSAYGTASFKGHLFFLEDPATGERLKSFTVDEYPNNIQFYDPYEDDPVAEAGLSDSDRAELQDWRRTLRYNEIYLKHTGRSFLAKYPREPSSHFMWPAEYYGQEHWVTSQQTHFVKPIPFEGEVTSTSRVLLPEYRNPGIVNLTLKVLSIEPRVLEIENFLSETEVEHILAIAGTEKLRESITGALEDHEAQKALRKDKSISKTRTSRNSWVERSRSPVVDAVYRRAADVMRIDEALLRDREPSEFPDLPSSLSLAESLQLVSYAPGQEYTAHHDFGYVVLGQDQWQRARYSTLLLYLNDVEEGGATSFPRWRNAETFEALDVKPKIGKAVLFYSQLPDGNLDCLSQHAAKPVVKGEKWLINLWTWDPVYNF